MIIIWDLLFRTLISSLVVILGFYSLPLIANFTNDNILNKEFRNNSKTVLAYTLDKQTSGNLDGDEQYDERDLLVDIYNLNEKETDAVRLDASTILQLYEDTNYKLDDIRKNKLVKPVALQNYFRVKLKRLRVLKREKNFLFK